MTKENKNKKKKRSLLAGLFIGCLPKAFMLVLLFVIVLLISINFLPKSKFFQDFAGEQITNILEDQLKAQTKIGSIFFDKLGYLELNQVFVITAGDTLAYIPKVIVDVDLWEFFDKKIEINQLSLENPHIKMIRSLDSTWNVTHIVKPSEEKPQDSSSVPFIEIENFKINSGNFLLYDSLNVKPEDHQKSKLLNYSYLQLAKLNVDLSGDIDLDSKKMDFDIDQISFIESRTELNVENTYFNDLAFDDNSIRFDDFSIELNGEKIISNEMELNNFSVLNPEKIDITKAEIFSNFNTDGFSISNIEHFTDGVKILSGKFAFEFEIEGNMSEPSITKMNVKNDNIDAEMTAKIDNLFSERINYKLKSNKINTNNRFITELINTIPRNSLPGYNNYKLKELKINGGIKSAEISLEMLADRTDLKGNAKLHFADLSFSSNLSVNRFNLAHVTQNSIKSNLNGKIKATGKGFDVFKDSLNIALDLADSQINDIPIHFLSTKISANKGLYDIDSFKFGVDTSNVIITGNLDISDINEPYYFLKLETENFNSDIFAESLPNNINGEIVISGRGFDPENMDLNLGSDLREFKIEDYLFEDIIISAKVLSDTSGYKQLTLSSDFLDVQSVGNFKFADLAKIIEVETEIFTKKISSINSIVADTMKIDSLFKKRYSLPKTKIELQANLKDLSKFETIFQGYNLKTSGELALEMTTDTTNFFLNVRKLDFKETNFSIEKDTLKMDDVIFGLLVSHDLSNIQPRFEELSLSLKTPKIFYGKEVLDSTKLNFTIRDKSLDINFGATLNNEFIFDFNGEMTKNEDNISFDFTDFLFGYVDLVKYENVGALTGRIKSGNVHLDDLTLKDKNEETIGLSGDYNFLTHQFKDLNLNLENYSFENLVQVTSDNPLLDFLKGSISILSLNLNGSFEDPRIDITADGKAIRYNEVDLGRISSELHYQDRVLYGDLYLFNPEKGTNFSVNINTFPIDLRLLDVEERLHNSDSAEIYVDISKLPAKTIEPLVPGLKNFKGSFSGGIRITGDATDHLIYDGNIGFDNTAFLVEATNIEYKADAKISISNDYIDLEKFVVRNRSQDLKNGSAIVSGFMKMDNFNPSEFEFRVRSDEIKVLREETKYSLPSIYGDLIIGTGNRSLVFSGSFDKPNLTGDIIIRKADLKMPDETEAQLVQSKLKYVFKDSLLVIEKHEKGKTLEKESSSDFADLINYDLFIDFENDMRLDYDVNALLEMTAFINAENFYYRQDREKDLPQIIGKIIVKEPSKVRVVGIPQNFEAEGDVSFPTGDITNPRLNIVAKYNNVDKKGVDYQLRILITGTNEKPQIDFELTYNNQEFTGEQAEKDFYSLITVNSRTQDRGQVSSSGAGLEDTGVDITNSLVSNLISKNISQATGFDANVNVDLNDPDNSTVEFGGEIFRGVRWSLGGSLANPENNEISVVIPARVIIPYSILDNLIIELSKPNNPYATRENQKQWEINLNYHGKW